MYSDPNVTYEFCLLGNGAPVEVESTAAICARIGRVADEADAASAVIDGVRCPSGCQIDEFGVTLTEALTNGQATHCTVELKVAAYEGDTPASIAVITLPKNTTEVVVADIRPEGKTATQAVAAGARIKSSDASIPYTVPPGGYFYVEVTQAAGGAGGAFRPFVVARQNGSCAPVSASPVTSIAA